ncbi:MAG: GreA/GreB family elongation factor [Kiritimatiellia bacterium]
MQLPEGWESKSACELEEWFLGTLGSGTLPLDAALCLLQHVGTRESNVAEEWVTLLQSDLVEKKDRPGLLRVLSVRLQWRPEDSGLREEFRTILTAAFDDTTGKAFLKNCGLESERISLSAVLRRLDLLISLKPGRLCLHRTWGFGIVSRVDAFYEKVTIDFEKKATHQMSFAYAAESLELIPEEHILALHHRNPAQLQSLVKENPAEVVRMALCSYGPLTAPRLQEILLGKIVREDDWPRFWEEARRGLKTDPLVKLPAKRSDPIRLRDRLRDYDEHWFEELATERQCPAILERVSELVSQKPVRDLSPKHQQIIVERLAYALEGVKDSHPDLFARILVLAAEAKIGEEEMGMLAAIESLLQPSALVKTLSRLSARDVERLLILVGSRHPDRLADTILATFNDLPVHTLEPCARFLSDRNRKAELEQRVTCLIRARKAGPAVLYYVCRHLELMQSAAAIPAPDMLTQVVECLEKRLTHDQRKAQKQLMALFEEEAWLAGVTSLLDETQRKMFLKRIYNAQGWDISARRSVMAKLIRLRPELGSVLGEVADTDKSPQRQRQLTSWHSYRARQAQLQRLIEVELPQNSREIALARSYGDLSENYEYKAAKEHQRILLRRKETLERELQEVDGTDFSNVPTDVVAPGTSVCVERPDGTRKRYAILGEWDRDEALGIIPAGSLIAKVLKGRRAGDEVQLPVADVPGDSSAQLEVCRIVSVDGLPDEVRRWIDGVEQGV